MPLQFQPLIRQVGQRLDCLLLLACRPLRHDEAARGRSSHSVIDLREVLLLLLRFLLCLGYVLVVIQSLRVVVRELLLLLLIVRRAHWWLVGARFGHDDRRKQALLADVVLLVGLDDVVDQGAVFWQEHAGDLKRLAVPHLRGPDFDVLLRALFFLHLGRLETDLCAHAKVGDDV